VPIFENHVVLELSRNLRAFLRLEAGLTRNEASPDPAARLDRKFERASERARRRDERLGRTRRRLAESERLVTELRAELEGKSAGRGATEERARIVERFHRLYYDSAPRTWHDTSWMGVPIWKCPLDLWVYGEIVSERRPDLIVETGTAFGGSGLYLAHLCELVGNGRVMTVDLNEPLANPAPEHERMEYVRGSSTAPEVLERVRRRAADARRVMVVLDSDHRKEHVLQELRTYGPMVTPGDYLVVEDTSVNGNPVLPDHGPGPMEAVEEFLAEDSGGFVVDRSKEKFYLTFNPRGYLRKVG
jgi:cephalosporin hydroxylase